MEYLSIIIIASVIVTLIIGIYVRSKDSSSLNDELESPEDKVLVKIGLKEHAIMRREDAEVYKSLPREAKRKVIKKLKERAPKK
jgi:hypothetical protein